MEEEAEHEDDKDEDVKELLGGYRFHVWVTQHIDVSDAGYTEDLEHCPVEVRPIEGESWHHHQHLSTLSSNHNMLECFSNLLWFDQPHSSISLLLTESFPAAIWDLTSSVLTKRGHSPTILTFSFR